MAMSERNFFILMASAFLLVSAIRDLFDKKCRGISRISTWFLAIFQFMTGFYLLVLLR
jgi:hypothetical protein